MTDSESSSDPEDFEYIPEGEVERSDSEASVGGEEEDKRGVSRSGRKKQTTLTTSARNTRRQKRRGVQFDNDAVDEEGGKEADEDEEEEDGGEREKREEEKQKKERARVDDLWATFKQDTGLRLTQDRLPKISADGDGSTKSKNDESKMVKIKKTYDFAGDEIVVEKEVAADSKEARLSVCTPQASTTTSPPPTLSSSSSLTLQSRKPTSAGSSVPRPILAGSKRSGLSSVLQSLSKKPKMSTLEKSQLDWEKFKTDEGLEHELSQQRKDGYLERQDFLQRTDVRQFELEKEERLKKYRRLH